MDEEEAPSLSIFPFHLHDRLQPAAPTAAAAQQQHVVPTGARCRQSSKHHLSKTHITPMQEKSTMFYLGARSTFQLFLVCTLSSPYTSLSSLLLIFLSYSPVEETRGVLMTREMDVRTRNLVHSASQQEHYVLYGAGGLRARGVSLPPTLPPSLSPFIPFHSSLVRLPAEIEILSTSRGSKRGAVSLDVARPTHPQPSHPRAFLCEQLKREKG